MCFLPCPQTLTPSVCITQNCSISPFYWLLDSLKKSKLRLQQHKYSLPPSHCHYVSFLLPPRAECLPQHGGSCGQQHTVGSGLHQAADSAAVCALLQPSSPLRPQCRTAAEERHAAAGWVRQHVKDFTPCWLFPREGEVVESMFLKSETVTRLCCVKCTLTHAHTVFMDFHSPGVRISAPVLTRQHK